MDSLFDPTLNPNGNETLSARDVERILTSIRGDARKIKHALIAMERDAEKLRAGGSHVSAVVLAETVICMRVALGHLQDVFRETI